MGIKWALFKPEENIDAESKTHKLLVSSATNLNQVNFN